MFYWKDSNPAIKSALVFAAISGCLLLGFAWGLTANQGLDKLIAAVLTIVAVLLIVLAFTSFIGWESVNLEEDE